MSPISSWICTVLILTLSSVAPSAECTRVHLRHELKESREGKARFFRSPNDAERADFEGWVSREGNKYQLKQEQNFSPDRTGSSPDSSLTSEGSGSYDVQTVLIVDKTGLGQFTTLQGAIDSIENDQDRTQRITIQINPGHYSEKVIIPKNLPYLTLQGGGREVTIIEHSETKEQAGSDIADATIAIRGPNFVARNVTFQNSAPAPPSGAVGQQATAVYISGDMGAFYGCGFLGAQDTLYDHNGRHYFEDCYIEGSIDFIYGNGKSLYKSCQLNVIPTTTGSLTAQKRMSNTDDSGFSFVDCWVTGAGRVYLGRAWGRNSRVVFSTSWLTDIVIPEGWQDWSDPSRDPTVYYGEYNCFGPGANAEGRVGWSRRLTYAEALPFLSLSFVDGESWISS